MAQLLCGFGDVGKQGGKVGFVEARHQFRRKLPPACNERCVFDVGGGGEAKTCVGDGIEQSSVVVVCQVGGKPVLQEGNCDIVEGSG